MFRTGDSGHDFSFSRWREKVPKAAEGGASGCDIARPGAILARCAARADLSRRRERWISETRCGRAHHRNDPLVALMRFGTVALLLALGGCVETRFEAPLGDNIETCDARWKGLWNDAGSATEPSAVFVDDDCRFIVLDQPERGGPLKQIHVPVNFVHADGKDYLVVADTALKGLAEIKAPHGIEPAPDKSFYFVRYHLRGDRIELDQVDSERVAKLVVDGTLEGTVDKTANELHVFVRGTRTRMLEIVRTQPIFDSKRPTVLAKRKQTIEEFERTVLEAQRKSK